MSVFYPQVTHNIGGNTSGTTANVFGNTLFLAGGNNITLSQDVNTITISAAAGGGTGGDAIRGIAAGGSTQTTDTVNLSNSNGFSFGFSSTNITASHNALTSQSTQYLAVQLGGNTAGTTSFNASNDATIVLHGGNNITLSGSGSTITIIGTAGTGAGDAIRGIAAGGSTQTTDTVNFSNSNGISFGFTSTDLTASHNAITSQSTQYLAIELGGNTAGTTSFNASNNASIFLHGGNNITLSGNGSTITISGGAGSGGNVPVIYQYPKELLTNGTIDRTEVDAQYQGAAGGVSTYRMTMYVKYAPITADLYFNQIEQLISFWTGPFTSNLNNPDCNRFFFGIYTKTGDTLSRLSSFHAGISADVTGTGTVGTANVVWWWGLASTANSSSTSGAGGIMSDFADQRRIILWTGTNGTLTSGNYYFVNIFNNFGLIQEFGASVFYGNRPVTQQDLNAGNINPVDLDGGISTSQTWNSAGSRTQSVLPVSFNTSAISRGNFKNIAVTLYSKY